MLFSDNILETTNPAKIPLAVTAGHLTSITVMGGKNVVVDQGGTWPQRTTPAGRIFITSGFLPKPDIFRVLPDRFQRLLPDRAEVTLLYLDFLAKHPAGVGMP